LNTVVPHGALFIMAVIKRLHPSGTRKNAVLSRSIVEKTPTRVSRPMPALKETEGTIRSLEQRLAGDLSEGEQSIVEKLLYLARLTARVQRRFPETSDRNGEKEAAATYARAKRLRPHRASTSLRGKKPNRSNAAQTALATRSTRPNHSYGA
jgi:hypothetical protein